MMISRAALAATLSLAAGTAGAQVAPNIVELEGPIHDVTCVSPGYPGIPCTEVAMNVMGTTVRVPQGTPVASPSAELSFDQLVSRAPLLGSQGFIGGTAKLTGVSTATGPVADNVLVELSENVFLGSVTKNDPRNRSFKVEGTEVVLLPATQAGNSFPAGQATYDGRMPGLPLMNDYGFRIRAATIPVGTLVAAEGYHDGGKFYAFTMEVTGGELVNPDQSQVSILRAQCRERGANQIELEVRGATYLPANATVRFFSPPRPATGTTPAVRAVDYGNVTATPDVDGFGVYDYDVRIAPPAGSAGCPASLRAEMTNPTNTTTRVLSRVTVVDIRVD